MARLSILAALAIVLAGCGRSPSPTAPAAKSKKGAVGVSVLAGVLFHLGWMTFAYLTLRLDQRSWRVRQSLIAIG